MAEERALSLNSLLCFAFFGFRKHTSKLMKSVITDYYTADNVNVAKETLAADIDALGLANWARPVKRRGDNKTKQEIDDIFTAITFVDESAGLLKLPRYVVENLDELPLMRMEKGEFAVLVAKLDKIEENVSNLSMHIGQDTLARPTSISYAPTQGSRAQSSIGVPSRLNASFHTSIQSRNVASDNESTDYGTDSNATHDGYTEVINNRKKRRHSSKGNGSVANNMPTTGQISAVVHSGSLWSDRVVESRPIVSAVTPGLGHANNTSTNRKKSMKVFGRGKITSQAEQSTSTRILKSAKPYIKKAVYGLYNVDQSESVDSINDFIDQTCGSKPISCFKINSNDTESIAFRICIDASRSDTFLNPDIWASGIIIRPWKFKPKVIAGPLVSSGGTLASGSKDAPQPIPAAERSADAADKNLNQAAIALNTKNDSFTSMDDESVQNAND